MYKALRYFLIVLSLFAFPSINSVSADTLAESSTYFRLQADLRLCPSPLCGGAFASRVNQALTQCADGSARTQCYVSEVDYSHLGLSGDRLTSFQAAALAGRALLRGVILPGPSFGNSGPLGKLAVSEGWLAATNTAPEGPFFRVRDNGLRCITTPCFSIHEHRLNTLQHRDISSVDLSRKGASAAKVEAGLAAINAASLLVAGINLLGETGPAGKGVELVASQFYLRVTPGK